MISVSCSRYRARKLKPRGKCELCTEEGKHVHHVDKNPFNNDITNLQRLCVKCHFAQHKVEKEPFVFIFNNTMSYVNGISYLTGKPFNQIIDDIMASYEGGPDEEGEYLSSEIKRIYDEEIEKGLNEPSRDKGRET
jgi:hypothetical protein